MSSLLDKLRALMGGSSDERAEVRRALEHCMNHGWKLTIESARRGASPDAMIASVEQVRENDFIIDRPMVGAHVKPLAVNEPLRISFMGATGHCSGLTRPLGRFRFSSGSSDNGRVLYGYRMALPEELETSNRRHSHRVSLERGAPMHVALHPSGGVDPMKAIVLDISAGGMRLRLNDEVMLISGQEMLLTADFPPPFGSVAERARIVRITTCPRTNRLIVGINFTEEVTSISRYVRQLEIERSRRAGAA